MKTFDNLLNEAREALRALMDAYVERLGYDPEDAEYEAVFYARKCAQYHRKDVLEAGR